MVIKNNYVFKLFANCHIVEGANRSIIYDFNGRVFIVPSKFAKLLSFFKNKNGISYEVIVNNERLVQFVEELYRKQMGKYFNKHIVENFPDIEIKWDSPHSITNAIIDINNTSTSNWSKFITELDEIGCSFVQIRLFGLVSFEQLNAMLKKIDVTNIYGIQLIIPLNNNNSLFFIELSKLLQLYPRIVDTIIYNCNITHHPPPEFIKRVRTTNEIINNQDSCGIINPNFFILNLDFFSEANLYNTCLNRKISLSHDGFVKNCPSMRQDYGNIDNICLEDVASSSEFKFWWFIKKDKVEVCKDCEFRYMCSDCRVFITDSKNPFSKPSKCPYDPYTCKGF